MNAINRIGQKIVCILNKTEFLKFRCAGIFFGAPNYGQVFTVTGFSALGEEPCVHLRELDDMQCSCNAIIAGWPLTAFRPVDERKTDISVFKDILIGEMVE